MYGAKFNHEVNFFITGQKISGIESASISYEHQYSIINPLGYSKGINIPTDKNRASVSLSRYLIFNDPLLQCTGAINITGISMHFDRKNYYFDSHIYMTEYMVNCAVGSIPKVTTNFICFGGSSVESLFGASGNRQHPPVYIPNQGSISIDYDGNISDRVVGFDYSVKCDRKPYYSIGSGLHPVHVMSMTPLEYSASMEIEIDDSNMNIIEEFYEQRQNRNLNFIIKGPNNESIQNFPIPNASLVEESLSISSDNVLKLTMNIVGHE